MNSDTSMPSPESVHISVLLNEAVDALAPKAGGRYLDGTVGMGGHSFAIMERTGGEGFLCGLDRDTQALELARIRLAPFGDRVHLVHTRYSEFEAALDGKRTFRADTPEELARQLCVDEKGLCKTIADYNEFCRTGMDWDGYKDSADLVAMTGPYYAVRAYLGTDGAFGGVEIDEHMQAKAADGGTVDGLFVVGDLASGRFLNMAGIKKQILNDMSFAVSSGYVAGTYVGNM